MAHTPASTRAYRDANKAKIAVAAHTYYLANKEAILAQHKVWKGANSARVKAKNHEWYLANKEHCNQRTAAWRTANPKRARAIDRAYRTLHRLLINARNRARRWANLAAALAYHQAWRLANPGKTALYSKRHRTKHLARRRAQDRLYAQTHRELIRAKQARRRALQRGAPINDLSAAQWREILAAEKHRCVYCGKRLKDNETQDHLTALAQAGSHTVSNVLPACRRCNSSKGKGNVLKPVQPYFLTVAPSRKVKPYKFLYY